MPDFNLKCDALSLHMILLHIKHLEAFEKTEIFLALLHYYYCAFFNVFIVGSIDL